MNTARAFVASLAVSAMLLAVPAQAQVVDLSKTTCKEFLESSQNGRASCRERVFRVV